MPQPMGSPRSLEFAIALPQTVRPTKPMGSLQAMRPPRHLPPLQSMVSPRTLGSPMALQQPKGRRNHGIAETKRRNPWGHRNP